MTSKIQGVGTLIPNNPSSITFEDDLRTSFETLLTALKQMDADFRHYSGYPPDGSGFTGKGFQAEVSGVTSQMISLVDNGRTLDTSNAKAPTGGFATLQSRFAKGELRIKDLENAQVLFHDLRADYFTTVGSWGSLDQRLAAMESVTGNINTVMTKTDADDTYAKINGESANLFEVKTVDPLDTTNHKGSHAINYSYATANLASISGSSTEDFNAKSLTLPLGSGIQLNDSPILSLKDPVDPKDAANKRYVDSKTDTKAEKNYVDNALLSKAALAGDPLQNFDVQTLTVSAGLDMNSQFIANLPDPTANDHAVNVNYLTANYTNTTDLVNNYAAIAGSPTQDFDIQKLTVHDDVDMNSKLITNLPNPTGAGHAVNYDYLIANYTDNNALALTYAGISGSSGQPFDVQDPNDNHDADQDTWAISRAFADGRYAKQEGDAAINFNADTLTVNSLVLGSNLDMAGKTIENLLKPDAANAAHAKYAASREYVDDVQVLLSNSISAVASNMVPTYGIPEDGKFLSVSSSGLIWVNPPTVDTSTPSYEWLSHPQVAFHSVQFEEQLYVNHTLAANRVYYVAGNLEFPDLMADGTTPCTSTLTAASGAGTDKGATLIVQGHIIGDLTRLIEDNTNTNLPRVIVQNWADSRADYVISGTVNTSDLNLTEDLVFASRLVLESGAVLNVDSGCNLTFKELVDNGGTINETSGSVNYFDPQKLIENAPAAVDTLKEISDLLKDSATNSFINVADALNTHITGDFGTLNTTVSNHISNDFSTLNTTVSNHISNDFGTLNTTVSNHISNDFSALNTTVSDHISNDFSALNTTVSDHISNDFSALNTQVQTLDTATQNLNFRVGNFTYIDPSNNADGHHIYKFSP